MYLTPGKPLVLGAIGLIYASEVLAYTLNSHPSRSLPTLPTLLYTAATRDFERIQYDAASHQSVLFILVSKLGEECFRELRRVWFIVAVVCSCEVASLFGAPGYDVRMCWGHLLLGKWY